MSKKPLYSRLDDLFKEIHTGKAEQPETRSLPGGWYWECTLDGAYLSCSPEVWDCLGIPADDFKNRPVFDYQIHPDSGARLRAAFHHDKFPQEVDVLFISAQGELVPARISILTQVGRNGNEPRWHGFVQLVPDNAPAQPGQNIPAVRSNEPPPKKPVTGPLKSNGLALDKGALQPSKGLWSRAGIQSLAQNEAVAHSGDSEGLAAMAVPFNLPNQAAGIVEIVDDTDQRKWTDDDRLLVQAVANQLAMALENAGLYQTVQQELSERIRAEREAQRRALELETAAAIARDTTSTLSLDALLEGIVNLLCQRFNFDHTSIFLVDAAKNYAVIRESTGEAGQEMKRTGHKVALGSKSVIGAVTASGEPLIINDVAASPLHMTNPLLPETRSEMAIPLKLGDQVIGALDIQSRQVNSFSQDDVSVLQILADQIAIAIENARAYEMSQKAVEEMREIDRVKSQFLANMSHELRTPLNSIIGFSRVIMKGIDGPVNETQGQDLTAIYNSGQHLLNLINDILDLSKIEAGKMELSFAEVNLAEMINSVMSTAIGLVKSKSVRLNQNLAPDLPLVRADGIRVRQVLLNLISNAAKFTDEGSITVETQVVRSPLSQPEVMVSVTDTGAGIAPEDTHKLFQPFSQVDDSPTRKTGGTGLGLSICRSLIEMHGGRIGLLRSQVGVGSTFFFTLPLGLPEPPAEPEALPPGAKIILAVDDDAQVIRLYERYLKLHGYRVVALTDPAQAVERAREIKPAAITLDVMMPNRDGWQVMHDLKNNPDTRSIPVIVCSILEEEEKGFSLGAADYLVKPFAQDELLNAINRLNFDGNIHEVLVIDDSPADRRLVEKMIAVNAKFHVTTAEDGQAGWESIRAGKPDVIVLDLFMPGLNGFELLERLRAYRDLRSIPVIILTGADLTPEQRRLLAEFGQQLLAKGQLNEKELLLSLKNCLQQYHLIEEPPSH